MGASKHIVHGWVDFVNFYYYPVDPQTVVLGNDSEEHVLDIATYQLKLRGGNKLFLHYALYAPRVQRTFVPFSSDVSFLSWFPSISTSSIFAFFIELCFQANSTWQKVKVEWTS